MVKIENWGVRLHPLLQNILFLSAERSGQMNISAAWDFIDSMVGVDYGYEVYQLLSSGLLLRFVGLILFAR